MDSKGVSFPLFVLVAFSIYSAESLIAGCPEYHEYAFYDGSYCCSLPEEANATLLVYGNPSRLVNFNPPCDGGSLRLNSKCCKDGKWIPCPHGKGQCRSTIREICYSAEEYVGVGVPSLQFRRWCAEQSTLPTESGAINIAIIKREAFFYDGKEWMWGLDFECRYSPLDKYWDCDEVYAVSDGSDSKTAKPTAGLTRALVRPPSDSQCKLPKRWVRTRGKLRCRRPRRF